MAEQPGHLADMSPFQDGNGAGERPANGSLRHLLGGVTFGIRPGEGKIAWAFFLYFLILATSHYAGKSVRQSTYIDVLGADKLPFVYLLVALTSFPVLVLYSRLAERFRQPRLIAVFCLIQSAALLLFFWLYSLDQIWVPLAYYVWMTIAFGIAISQLWSYANHIFDPRQARRLFAFIGAGGLLGGIPGGQIARTVASLFGTRHTLIASALLMLALIVVVGVISRLHRQRHMVSMGEKVSPRIKEARGGFRTVLDNRLLLLIAVLMLLTVVVAQMVDLQFNWAIEQSTEKLDERTEVFGNFFSLMGLFAFFFQLIFTQRIHRVLGVGFGMRVLPSAVAMGTVGLILSVSVLPFPLLIAAWVLKLSETGLRHSLDQATRELLFLPVPSQIRRQAKAFIDVFVQRFAKGVAALVLLTVTFGLLSVIQVGWLTLLLTAVWIWVTVMARQEYVRAFRQGLKPVSSDASVSIDTNDITTFTTLVESLGSSDPRMVLHALDLLATHGHGRLVQPLLLYHGDREVRRRTLQVLAKEGRRDTIPLIESTIGDDDPGVRAAAIEALAVLQGEDSQALMLPRLNDPDLRLRSAAIVSLSSSKDPEVASRAEAGLAEMLVDVDPEVRATAAKTLGQIPEPSGCASLVQLLYDSELPVVREAILAVRRRLARDGQNVLYVPILISLMGDRRLKHDAREALVAYGESAINAMILFMRSTDEQIWVRRAVPKTVAILGGSAAAEALVRSLDASDSFLRRKLIEALVYMRSRTPKITIRADIIKRQLRAEAECYLRAMADLWAVSSMYEVHLEGPHAQWKAGGQVPTLLQQLLAQGMTHAVANIFGLLMLLYQPADLRAAYRSLTSGQAFLRARALEYLDNTLSGSVRRNVFAVIDDSTPEEKLRQAESTLGITIETPEETLRRLICTDTADNSDGAAFVIGAIYSVYSERLTSFYPLVCTLTSPGQEQLIRETAQWVVSKVENPSAGRQQQASNQDEELEMAPMARIEMVVFLQTVDLFAYCNAEQMVRLAAIASESHALKGETIFSRNQPPEALYCVVEGSVDLTGANEQRAVGAKETFGVTDIMSGQLRSFDATAAEDTRLLVIEAEDFFDLLSNNIEIVKALFRRLTTQG
jgi:AAA family ATP:ADP antiporter